MSGRHYNHRWGHYTPQLGPKHRAGLRTSFSRIPTALNTTLRHLWAIKKKLIHTKSRSMLKFYKRISPASRDESSAVPTCSCEPLRFPGYPRLVIQLKGSS